MVNLLQKIYSKELSSNTSSVTSGTNPNRDIGEKEAIFFLSCLLLQSPLHGYPQGLSNILIWKNLTHFPNLEKTSPFHMEILQGHIFQGLTKLQHSKQLWDNWNSNNLLFWIFNTRLNFFWKNRLPFTVRIRYPNNKLLWKIKFLQRPVPI